MKFFVKVKPNSKKEKIEKVSFSELVIWTKKPAKQNKANNDVVKILAEYFSLPKSCVNLVKGKNSKNKIFEISCLI